MPTQISKGETFTDVSPGKSVTSTRLNNHVDNATLLPGAITEQTELTAPAALDYLLATSGGALKKLDVRNTVAPETIVGGTGTEREVLTSPADGDRLLIADADDSYAVKAISPSNLLTPEVISSKGTLTPANGDSLLALDATDSTLKELFLQDILVPEAISSKGPLTVTAGADTVLVHDATDSTLKEAALSNLLPVYVSSNTTIPAAGATETFAHGLGALPRLVRVVIVPTSSDAASEYTDTDGEIDASAGMTTSYAGPMLTFRCDATNVKVLRNASNSMLLPRRSDGSTTGVTSSANFKIKVYAFL